MSKLFHASKRIITVALVIPLALPLVAGFGAPATPAAPQRLLLDVTGWEDRTTQANQQHIPTPGAATNIGPGSKLLIEMDGGLYLCTANFIWTGSNGKTYLGAAGHCFVPPGTTATHGPGADWDPADTSVEVCISGCNFGGQTGFIIQGTTVQLGPVAYARQTDVGGDLGNDFGLVEIPSSQSARVRPSMPMWGGPIGTTQITTGKPMCHYGNAMVFGETFPTMGRVGVGVRSAGNYFVMDSASMQGDSGSAVVACGQDAGGLHGQGAIGLITHLGVDLGFVLGTTVARAQSMASSQAGLTITVMNGT